MGILRSIQTLFSGKNNSVEIVIIGLDNSGKTTIINQIRPPESQLSTITPTIGYNVEKFSVANMTFVCYDMSGQTRYRNLWETQYKNIHGIIFVVDSADRLRIAVARDELWLLLDHKDLLNRKIPLLIFANKSDLRGSLTTAEVYLSLGLDLIRNRNWTIMASCAINGQGIRAGIEWLAANIKEYLSL